MSGYAPDARVRNALEAVHALRQQGSTVRAYDTAVAALADLGGRGEEQAELLRGLAREWGGRREGWCDPYPRATPEAVMRGEWSGRNIPLAETLRSSAVELQGQGRLGDAQLHLRAALTLVAEFGVSGYPRVDMLRELVGVSRAIGASEDQLAAARTLYLLTDQHDDAVAEHARFLLGVALLEAGEKEEARAHLSEVVVLRRRLDKSGLRQAWVHEAERLLDLAAGS